MENKGGFVEPVPYAEGALARYAKLLADDFGASEGGGEEAEDCRVVFDDATLF